MAGNRAVSSHADRAGLALTGVPGAAALPLGRMTSQAEVDEVDKHVRKSEPPF